MARDKGTIAHVASWLAGLDPYPASLAALEQRARQDLETARGRLRYG